MTIPAASNTQDPLALKLSQKSLSQQIWFKARITFGQYTGTYYLQVTKLDTASDTFHIWCRAISEVFVDDYYFEGEDAYPSASIKELFFPSWWFYVITPVVVYSNAEMKELLDANDEIFRQGWFDWYQEEPRLPRGDYL